MLRTGQPVTLRPAQPDDAAAIAVAAAWPSEVEAQRQVETDHFVIVARDDSVTDEEMELADAAAEGFYEAIRDLLGIEPASRIVVALNGPAEQPDGSWGYPRVDGRGTIHLYRYTDAPEGYFSALAHEIVHVLRRDRMPYHDWFFEEGFAEFVARRVDTSQDGFPWYGYPVEIVAAQWIMEGEDIPLTTLREHHRSVNLPCKLQSYALRGSFFHWLGETYGDGKLIAMSAADAAGSLPDYERFFGKSFEALEKEWRKALIAAYEASERGETLARQYRRKSPAQYLTVCPQDGPADSAR